MWLFRMLYRKCVIFVNSSNQISVSINGVAVITNLALPAAFQSADKTNWQYAFAGRTGGATDNHWIDNLVINAYNQYEHSIDGTTWTPIRHSQAWRPNLYPRIGNRAFTAYPVSLTAVSISQPANPTATVGVSNNS
ncbi:MAG: hypothetical protein IPN22_15005 [Bacteroidetes bacterium]|nr:hypothetical protein [Bacteroidota bacterium]